MSALVPLDDLPDNLVPEDDLPEDVAAPAAPRLDAIDRGVNMVGRGAWAIPGLLGLDAETAQAAWDAADLPGGDDLPGTFGERFDQAKAARLAQSRQVDADNPVTSGLVRGVASAPGEALAWGLAPEAKIPQTLARLGPFLSKFLTYGPRMGTLAGASEYGSTASKEPLERAEGAGVAAAGGILLGGTMAGALPNPAALMPRPGVETTVRPGRLPTTSAARTLQAEGVEGLTTGQRSPPSSFLSQLEAVSEHNPLGMKAERDAAKQSFMRTAQNKGIAPGAEPPVSTDLQGRLKELLEGFGPAYDAIKGKPIPPEVVADLPSAASMPRRGVDARTAGAVKTEVENALSVLGPEFKPPAPAHAHGGHGAPPAAPQGLVDQFGSPIPPPPKPPPKATAGDLLKVRENIREQVRTARQSQDFDRLRLLDQAEDVVTEALEKSLTPEEAAALRATDRQYARAMTAANAAPPGQTGFTPLQYLKQVEKSAGRRSFKKGEAGDLQDLGEAGREVFTDAPLTGFRGAVMSAVPGMKYLSAPVSRLVNSPGMQRFLFDPRVSTSHTSPMTSTAGQNAMLQELAEFLRAKYGLGPSAAGADEEASP